jgi:hypothetical protein
MGDLDSEMFQAVGMRRAPDVRLSVDNFGSSGSVFDEMEASRWYHEARSGGRLMLGRIAIDNEHAIIRVPSVLVSAAYGYMRGVGQLIKDNIKAN